VEHERRCVQKTTLRQHLKPIRPKQASGRLPERIIVC
jgi:hypothetical protein